MALACTRTDYLKNNESYKQNFSIDFSKKREALSNVCDSGYLDVIGQWDQSEEQYELRKKESIGDKNINNKDVEKKFLKVEEANEEEEFGAKPKVCNTISMISKLFDAQKRRIYVSGSFLVLKTMEDMSRVWEQVEGFLIGTTLVMCWSKDKDVVDPNEYESSSYDLIDSEFEVVNYGVLNILRITKFNKMKLEIRFDDINNYYTWIGGFFLSRFEYVSLNESYTAILLSLKTVKLFDINVLLCLKKLMRSEWCYIKILKDSDKWMKVFILIFPSNAFKNGKIEIYCNNKLSKKNLLAYIPIVSSAYAMYMNNDKSLDLSSIIKLHGKIYVNKFFAQILLNSNSNENKTRFFSLKNFKEINLQSFFYKFKDKNNQYKRGFKKIMKSFSVEPDGSKNLFTNNDIAKEVESKFFKKNNVDSNFHDSFSGEEDQKMCDSNTLKKLNKVKCKFVVLNQLYLLSYPHPGVSSSEIMIRSYLHIIDAFKLYGRPQKLISSKSNKKSLLFGLPSLPHYKYLSMKDSSNLIAHRLSTSLHEQWNETDWSTLFKFAIKKKVNHEKYMGYGNMLKINSKMLPLLKNYNWLFQEYNKNYGSGVSNLSNKKKVYKSNWSSYDSLNALNLNFGSNSDQCLKNNDCSQNSEILNREGKYKSTFLALSSYDCLIPESPSCINFSKLRKYKANKHVDSIINSSPEEDKKKNVTNESIINQNESINVNLSQEQEKKIISDITCTKLLTNGLNDKNEFSSLESTTATNNQYHNVSTKQQNEKSFLSDFIDFKFKSFTMDNGSDLLKSPTSTVVENVFYDSDAAQGERSHRNLNYSSHEDSLVASLKDISSTFKVDSLRPEKDNTNHVKLDFIPLENFRVSSVESRKRKLFFKRSNSLIKQNGSRKIKDRLKRISFYQYFLQGNKKNT